jgi:hypothetical protein
MPSAAARELLLCVLLAAINTALVYVLWFGVFAPESWWARRKKKKS